MLDKTPLYLRVDRTLLDPWRKLLLDAADYIDQHGWTRGKLIDWETGTVCARGAMLGAMGKVETNGSFNGKPILVLSYVRMWGKTEQEADNKLTDFLTRTDTAAGYTHDVAVWNNYVAKDQAEVVTTMRACALENVDQY